MSASLIQQLDFYDFTRNCDEINIKLFDKEKHGVVKVYAQDDQPVLFLKEVTSFDNNTIKQIAAVQHICWNFQKVIFLYVYSKTEIRIYNCSERPVVFNNSADDDFKNKLKELEIFTCKETDRSKLQTLNTLFSRIAIDTGFIWSAEEAHELRKKIKQQNRVDKFLIQSLINLSTALKKAGLEEEELIHKLVMRSLFLLYLEDRGATTKEFYTQFDLDATCYFDILKEPNYTYAVYKKLANDFNGSLFTVESDEMEKVTFEHLDLIKKCFINGNVSNDQIDLFQDWRLFDFSIIRIELLSEIYENFLNKLNKKETGTFYTPPSLVELILNEKLPFNNTNYKVKTLDPSCGSGIFLVQTFKRLVKRYENKHLEKLTKFDTLVSILTENIFGIEIDDKSIKVAAFSLYLALLDNLDPKNGWWNGSIKFPYLINNPDDDTLNEQGNNLFKRDTISDLSNIPQLQNFELVVGNPPFGTKNLLSSITNYCNKEKFAKEMVLPFLHKATLLAPKGQIALIFNTKILTNTGGTYQNFRKWLFNETYVEKIYNFSILRKAKKNFGGQLFGSAVGPISIVFYQKETPNKPSDTITYYAPKTYIKTDILESIVIDASDEKHLPRIECQKPDTKIWKIAMWGSYFDFKLITKLDRKHNTLENYFDINKSEWTTGSGLHSPSKEQVEKGTFFKPNQTLKTSEVARYYTSKNALEPNYKIFRPTNNKLYKSPFLFIKEGQSEKEYCSSIIDFDCYHMGYSIVNDQKVNLNFLCAYINSTFSNYYLSLFSSSWGIERERVQSNEMLFLPAVIDNIDKKQCEIISDKIDEIISIKKSNELVQNISDLEKQIDHIIFNDILKLTKNEQIIIQDTLDYSLDLFEKQENSLAVKHVAQIGDYSNRIAKELNDWLDDVDLKASITHYEIRGNCPLYMLKLTFGNELQPTFTSKEDIYDELKSLDQRLINEHVPGLYFRKKLNYYDGNDVYIIKPNQRRFWSQTAAMEDSKTLLIEIMKGNDNK